MGPNAVVLSTPQADRDYYRVGVGIDLVDLVAKIRSSKSTNNNPQIARNSDRSRM